jgi:hypothetical protein
MIMMEFFSILWAKKVGKFCPKDNNISQNCVEKTNLSKIFFQNTSPNKTNSNHQLLQRTNDQELNLELSNSLHKMKHSKWGK